MPSPDESAKVPFEPAQPVLDDDEPLAEYSRAQPAPTSRARTTMEVPIMRNRPFGDQLGGGDTPFFVDTGGGASPAGDRDDHDGVPTGLPRALARLDEVSEAEAGARAASPSPTSTPPGLDELDVLARRLADTEAQLARAKAVIPLTMAIGTITGGTAVGIISYLLLAP